MGVRISRRHFVRMAAGAGVAAGASVAVPWTFGPTPAWAWAQSPTVRKFVTGLPGLTPAGANGFGQYIPVAAKVTKRFAGLQTDTYDLGVAEYSEAMHPDLPGPTKFWGYYDRRTGDHKYLGGAIVANRGRPTLLDVANRLPDRELIPIDPTIMAGPGGTMVGDLPLNRVAVHFHGGLTPWFSDGTPLQWFDPRGRHGESFMNVPGTDPCRGSATYYYPMDQSARLGWYHDHAMGITRTNAYSGIASALVLVDDFEIDLVNRGLLPDLVGIPLVIQDKSFVPEDIGTQDPSWRWGGPGELWYPHVYEADNVLGGPNPVGRYEWGPTVDPPALDTMPLPTPASIVPEGFFDTILINGGVYPVATVTPKRVRFRLLNGSQARFYHLNLLAEDPATPGEAKMGAAGPTIYQVGTEGGFLPAVVKHRNTTLLTRLDPDTVDPGGPLNLLLAPGERADIVVDFNGVAPGSSFILFNDAPSPFPGGDPRNDYYTGNADQTPIGGAPSTAPGHGPNTRTLMKIVVAAGSGDSLGTHRWVDRLDARLRTNFLTGNQPGLLYRHHGDPSVPGFPYEGHVHRRLTLNEDFDEYGRLIQTLGTMKQRGTDNQGLPTWGLEYLAPATETPRAGTTEVWQIFNLTMDVHPIHFHLVNVQVLQRQAFEGTPSDYSLVGRPKRPDANELGWKETVRMNPGEVTTVMMRFDLPKLPTRAMREARSPRTGGHEYVWHCHILEHEEHDMMRPLIIR